MTSDVGATVYPTTQFSKGASRGATSVVVSSDRRGGRFTVSTKSLKKKKEQTEMAAHMTIILVLSLLPASVLCQTFQYSHGWTNGKRASTEVTSQLSFPGSWLKNLDSTQFNNLPVRCDIDKMRLLFQANANEALYLLPCEMSLPRRTLRDHPIVAQLRRGSSSENSNNYQM
ncbi:hypothetical protein KPH14_010059 [Odynerus spinipes]|uniref:Pro-corazonin n=1 Tax=Odynerus spinipes TaxID=1348599 RepID=A0AAD9RSZ4_9HYME|nr:hypothetical protein KPH14_010059 [Odynerus spinipes]